MARLALVHDDDAPPAEVKAVVDGLDAYNRSCVGPEDGTPLRLFLRDEQGAVAGGLLAYALFGWMFVQILWVDGRWRGEGYGEALLRRAEEEARARGCGWIWLDTFTFQAPGFYRKLGYEEFARLDDFPAGHARIYFKKRLDA
ncbi:MAG TPA: GNAT family N-acetyltransferase [Longimicrobiaceae bacterium]|nr:GNAT family N-acetyltransferase [Longimicrobiaceae bacterium]